MEIDLVMECIMPGFSSMAWYARHAPKVMLEDTATLLSSCFTSAEESGLIDLSNPKIPKDTRGNKEVAWLNPELCLPLPNSLAVHVLFDSKQVARVWWYS